jgi:predicted dehydrogenase
MGRQSFHPRVERSRHIHCPAYQPSGLVGSDEVDIVSICVKVPEHRKILRAALDAGKHVYCEWPLERNLHEAEELAAAAARAKVHVAIGFFSEQTTVDWA